MEFVDKVESVIKDDQDEEEALGDAPDEFLGMKLSIPGERIAGLSY
jgi:hypothetical protein